MSDTHPTILALHTAPSRALGVFTDSTGTTRVVLPRTFHPSAAPSTSIVHRAAPFSTIYLAAQRKVLDQRTIVVFVAGNAKGGAAVFFGPGSVHNLAEKLPATSLSPQTEKRAQLHALNRALSVIRRKVKRANEDVHTVVLATDSQYIVKSLTESVFEWRASGWRDDAGRLIEDAEKMEEADRVIEKLAKEGVDVEFWKVGREDNRDAGVMAAEVASGVR